jgi:hypothetical protein
MLGLLFAAFESMTGRAKGPVEQPKVEMKEDEVNAEREKAKGNVKGTGEANEVP